MSSAPNFTYRYKVGGSLEKDAPSYVVRSCDEQFYDALKENEFCYVLNSRQMGKSSLRVQAMARLQKENIACGVIDISAIGTHNITPSEWYISFVTRLVKSLGIKIKVKEWWYEREELSLIERFAEFIEEVLLVEIPQQIVIFIDEVDSIFKFDFKDDFFALIRAFYNQRPDNPALKRLSFALIGVATPSDLIEDKQRTPFNIGRAIDLYGFKLEEVQPLAKGLEGKVEQPLSLLQAILDWTGGQPYLTQKLCQIVVESSSFINAGKEAAVIEELVRSHILQSWESQELQEHLRTIRDRILSDQLKASRLLGLYQQILQQGAIVADNTPEHMALRLSGLVVASLGQLKTYNRIYESVFNLSWVEQKLTQLRPDFYVQALAAWVADHNRDESQLLRGEKLQQALKWSAGKSLSDRDYQFLAACQELENREFEEDLAQAQQQIALYREQEKQVNQRLIEAEKEVETRIKRGRIIVIVTSFLVGVAILTAGASFMNASKAFMNAKAQELLATDAKREAKEITEKANKEQDKAKREAEKAKQEADRAKQDNDRSKLGALQAQFAADNAKQEAEIAHEETQQAELRLKSVQGESDQIVDEAKQKVKEAKAKEERAIERQKQADNQAKIALKDIKKASRELQIKKLEKAANEAIQQFESDDQMSALLLAMQSGQELKTLLSEGDVKEYPGSVLLALWTVIEKIHEQNQFSGHQGRVNNVSFSPDGKYLATTGVDGIIRISNLSGKLQTQLQAPGDSITRFNNDSKYLFTAGKDDKLRLWDWSQQKIVTQSPAYGSPIISLSFSKNQKPLIATVGGTNNNQVKIWDWSGKQLATLNSQGQVWSVNFSPDEQHLVTTGEDKILLWNLSTQQSLSLVDRSAGTSAFSPDGKYIAASDGNGVARIWDISGKMLKQFDSREEWVKSISFSRDGKHLMMAGGDTARLWDNLLNEPTILNEFKLLVGGVGGASLSPDDNYIATSAFDGRARLLNLSNKQTVLSRTLFRSEWGGIRDVAFSPDKKVMATAGQDNTVRLYEYPSNKQLAVLNGHTWHVEKLTFSPNGQLLASASRDAKVRIWNLASRQTVAILKGYDNAGGDVSFSQDNQFIAIANDDGARIYQFSGNSWKEIRLLKGHYGGVLRVSFSLVEPIVATAGSDGTVRLWNLAGKQLALMKGHAGPIYRVKFSPDGKTIATAGHDRTVRLWNLSGQQLAVMRSYQSKAYGISFSPNGKHLVSAGTDYVVRFWDLSGQPLMQFPTNHDATIWSVNFIPDGYGVVTSGQDGTVQLSSFDELQDLDKLITRGCTWLKDYLANHPEEQKKLTVCKNQ